MTTKAITRIGRGALLIAPIVIAIVGFFTVLLWLKPRNTTFVMVLTAVVSVFVMAYAHLLSRRVGRRMDEIQVASMQFASFHGWLWGTGTTILLLLLPPVTNPLIDLADAMTAGAQDMTTRHRAAVLLGFYIGFMLLVLMKTACTIVAASIWHRRMSATPERS
jgi:hypothetical protein